MLPIRLLVLPVLCTLLSASWCLAVERSEIPDKYKWDRSHIFPSDADWKTAKDALVARVPEISRFEGRLGESPAALREALTTLMSLRLELDRVRTYASMLRNEDTRVSRGAEMSREARQIGVTLGTASAYMRPELIALGREAVMGMVEADPGLEEFRTHLDNIVRWAPHTRNPEVEKVVAQARNLTGAGGSISGTFRNAELPYPEATLTGGETVRLDGAGYSKYRQSSSREDRNIVFQAFWNRYHEFRRTFAASLYEEVKGRVFSRDVRGFESCVEASLFRNNIPVSVYRQLIADVNANLPALHRYLRIKEKMLGLDQIGYEDLYAPIVEDVDLRFTPEEAVELCVKSNEILGGEYTRVLAGAFEAGWMDIMPSTGKRSGAFSTMVYGVHPYQLMNFNGSYDDVSTMAHESGHSMHSYLAAQEQPFVTSDYSIFVAEVASTLNENLLFYSVLEEVKDPRTELFILGSALEGFRTTLFRQALFAEFELAIHEMVESGTPLTGDNLNQLYLELLRRYYGHEQGVCDIDELYAVEWAYIPHFYRGFYVYQYATSLVAGTSLAKGIREDMARGSTAKRDAYLEMLAAGSSKYPIDNLREAGVDMATSEPFAAAIQEMNEIMDRLEARLEEAPADGGAGRD